MHVSTSINHRSWQPGDNQVNKKETIIEQENPCDSEIPEWLQEFREILEDDEIPVQEGSHVSSSHEAFFWVHIQEKWEFG